MLAGDFLTYQIRAERSGSSPHCRSCPETYPKTESLNHILTECLAYQETRKRIFPEFIEAGKTAKSKVSFEDILRNSETLTQFILDPTSMNLEKRIHINDPALPSLRNLSHDYSYKVNSIRMQKLYTKNKDKN